MTAEDLARQYADQKVKESPCNEYKGYSLTKQKELTRFDGYDIEQAYEDGYLQAEKDLELTWEDILSILKIHVEVYEDETLGYQNKQEVCQEVLKRFNEQKYGK